MSQRPPRPSREVPFNQTARLFSGGPNVQPGAQQRQPGPQTATKHSMRHQGTELLQLSGRTTTPLGPLHDDPASSTLHVTEAQLSTLPPNAPEWMRNARILALRLEEAIAEGQVTPSTLLRIERAALAYSALDNSSQQIARVAHLIRRAHRAIRETQRPELENAIRDCAEILFGSLTRRQRAITNLEAVVDLVRHIHSEADPWVATVDATSILLGWQSTAKTHAASAIRSALESHDDTD